MQLKDMIRRVCSLVDDVPSNSDIIDWLNDAKDKMATAVNATFPDITASPAMDATFAFDSKYHRIPVFYAAASYKAQESSLSEYGSFMSQFNDGLSEFVAKYSVPPQFRDDNSAQQFTVATATQTDFTVTKDMYSPSYGLSAVYVNGMSVDFEVEDSIFTLTVPAIQGDIVTAVWEESTSYYEAPNTLWNW